MGLAWDIHKASRKKKVVVQTGVSVPQKLELSNRATITVISLLPQTYREILRLPGRKFSMDPLDVPAAQKEGKIEIRENLPTPEWWLSKGRILEVLPDCHAIPKRYDPLPHSLKIVSGCDYDPGNAAYRLHTAWNECSDHASAFVRYEDTNPFVSARQWDGKYDAPMVRALLLDAHVVHCHMTYLLPRNAGLGNRPSPKQALVRHYHGSMPKGKQWPELQMNIDDALGAILVGARLTLVEVRPDRMDWLPIAIPMRRYAGLTDLGRAKTWPRKPFRLAHSPTRRDYKSSDQLIAVVNRLKKKGLAIELVMIEKRTHAEALAIKASCDATFDSFWLGIQGSGLEGAAMGHPVIAGDPDVRALYEKHLGACPYTFANTERQLAEQLEHLATDRKFYMAEAKRVNTYIYDHHRYEAVVEKYNAILVKHGVLKLPDPKPDRRPPVRTPKPR